MAWTNLPSDQRNYVRDIETNLAALQRKVTPATLYSTTSPTPTTIAAAWNAAHPPAYAPQDYESIQWVDPSTNLLRNHYMNVPSFSEQRRLVEFPTAPIPFTKLGEIYADDAGLSATQTFSNIDQTYKHLCLYVMIRDSVNSLTANPSVRFNGLGTAVYGYSFQGSNSATSVGGEQVSQAGFLLPSPGNTSHRGFYHEGMMWIYDYARALRPVRIHHKGIYLTGATMNNAASNTIQGHGVFNSAVAVTSISVVSATGFVSGTRLVLFGV